MWESSDGERTACVPELRAGVTLEGLRTGITNWLGIPPQVGTDGHDSSEVATDAEVKGGVVTSSFYKERR